VHPTAAGVWHSAQIVRPQRWQSTAALAIRVPVTEVVRLVNPSLTVRSRGGDRIDASDPSIETDLDHDVFEGPIVAVLLTAFDLLLTTSRDAPSATSPKIVCLPCSQVVGTVVMKNCEPLVPLPPRDPALAIARR
jgi:hypothetical protein